MANVAPFAFAYDAHGRLSTTTQASRVWTQGYDSEGYLTSMTDPLSHATSYINDPVGRPTQTMLADGRLLATAYDGDSNTTSITLPSGELHDFSFTPVDLLASYEPPSVSSASPSTQYVYDLDRDLKTVTRPDGVTVTYGYDSAGRLQTTTIPQGTLTLRVQPVDRAPAVVDGPERRSTPVRVRRLPQDRRDLERTGARARCRWASTTTSG